jgi:hypothetical protein
MRARSQLVGCAAAGLVAAALLCLGASAQQPASEAGHGRLIEDLVAANRILAD